MPRTGVLLKLSREHHRSLVLGRDARRAAAESNSAAWSAAIARMEDHWHGQMAAHFEEEERLIRLAGEALDPQSVGWLLADHAALRTLARGPCALEPAERLRRFGELVTAHIRYEERVFFSQLQSHPCAGGGLEPD